MRDKKGSNYEGGHRAACFIRWPGGSLGSPRTIAYPAQVQDLLPTLIDFFDLDQYDGQAFDGISLSPLLNSASVEMPDRMFVVQHGGQVRPEKYFSSMGFHLPGDWKSNVPTKVFVMFSH